MSRIEQENRLRFRLDDLRKKFGEEDGIQMEKDYKELLQIPAFRRVLCAILKRTRVFASIAYDERDTNAIMKAIGFREAGVDIYFNANSADAKMVIKAIEERNQVETERKAQIEAIYSTERKGNN